MRIGDVYSWKHQPFDHLVYLGKNGSWYQFKKISESQDIIDLLDSDLCMIEETHEI